ncbi:hypothetical protein [Clostridium sp. OS1-26]|uniref:hypothetical protein n=1 Tax=Clostridium sp. OS1-26 TaxID=3070681 RepID=UPI0027E02DE5|nr:hypothetical protein [Clostridium sp. OS1-26]WML34694.1 hypothetical protein RCG18_26110 [Clostridium sp. OS1-26]
MKNVQEIYNSKVKNIAGALNLIQSKDVIFVAQAGAEPITLLDELHTISANGITGVELQNCLPMKNYEFINNSQYKDNIFVHGWYFTKALRDAQKEGMLLALHNMLI